MELSIIILNYKTQRLLRQCLKGIYAFPPAVSFEVIVVDNGSGEQTAKMIETEFSQVKFIALPENRGYARGSNVGIKAATGHYLLFLNADVVVLESSLTALYQYMNQHAGVGAAGPRLNNPDGSIQESAYGFHGYLTPLYQRTWLGLTARGKRELARFLMRDWDHASERSVAWLMSSCLIVRREALDAVGPFDERFFVYLADTDLCRRLWLKDWRVCYTPSATFFHFHRRQSAEDWRVAKIHILDWLRYLWKWRRQQPPDVR